MKVRFGFAALFLAALATRALATDVMIIDSGIDYKHVDLAAKMWSNPGETPENGVDDDQNGYADDIHGWNLAENNNQIIDYKYLGTFSDDCYKFFGIQGKLITGTATDADKAWYAEKRKDEAFIKELSKFGNFVHGTHVSGVAVEGNDDSGLQGIKLIPTEVPGAIVSQISRVDAMFDIKMKLLLGFVAKNNAGVMNNAGAYTAKTGAKTANGSFGISVAALAPNMKAIAQQLGGEINDAEAKEYAKYTINQILTEAKGLVTSSPDTLFVFAAGNDGTNNDVEPTSPANMKYDNTIAVAATIGGQNIAPFSNTGAKMVEVAAPGVLIKSTIPGDQYLEMSGTSMAAPYVTQVAAKVRNANPKLNPAGVKKILMGTVDVKTFLKGKVVTSGIVNLERAVKAGELSTNMTIDAAISAAKAQVADVTYERTDIDASQIYVTPLPTLF